MYIDRYTVHVHVQLCTIMYRDIYIDRYTVHVHVQLCTIETCTETDRYTVHVYTCT